MSVDDESCLFSQAEPFSGVGRGQLFLSTLFIGDESSFLRLQTGSVDDERRFAIEPLRFLAHEPQSVAQAPSSLADELRFVVHVRRFVGDEFQTVLDPPRFVRDRARNVPHDR